MDFDPYVELGITPGESEIFSDFETITSEPMTHSYPLPKSVRLPVLNRYPESGGLANFEKLEEYENTIKMLREALDEERRKEKETSDKLAKVLGSKEHRYRNRKEENQEKYVSKKYKRLAKHTKKLRKIINESEIEKQKIREKNEMLQKELKTLKAELNNLQCMMRREENVGQGFMKQKTENKSEKINRKKICLCHCDLCGKTYAHRSSLWRHLQAHEPPRYRCQKCGTTFHRKDNFDSHNCRLP